MIDNKVPVLLGIFLAIFVLIVAKPSVNDDSGKDLLHAECRVNWTLDEACDSAQNKIVDQIFLWDNGDCGNGTGQMNMKCMYKLLGTEGFYTFGTHTTWDFGYIDDFDFTFQEDGSGCYVLGHSKSRVLSLYDFGVNYCNVYNLMDGSGLVNDPGFTESSNDLVCTAYSFTNCTVY